MSFDDLFELGIVDLVGNRVVKYQNWLKIVVFTNFFLLSVTTILLQILIAKFRKKVSISKMACKCVLIFFHPAMNWRDNGSLLLQLFNGLIYRTIFPTFSTFWVNQKGVFSTVFSNWVILTALAMKSILNKFIECGQVNELGWNNFFEKNWFFTFLTQHFLSKKKEIVQKWEKVSFDGIFELAIVDLVSIEY